MVMHYIGIAVLRLIYNDGGVLVMVVVMYALYYN